MLSRSLCRFLGSNLSRIDGGLGSQIIGWMFYVVRKERIPETELDISYFSVPAKSVADMSGPTQWGWELNRFGIHFESLNGYRSIKSRRPNYEQIAKKNRAFHEALLTKDWQEIFPIPDDIQYSINNSIFKSQDKYGAFHIRRGDFLKVSSKLIDLSSVIKLASSIKQILPETLVFCSDDSFSSSEEEILKRSFPDHDIKFMNNPDQHFVHAVLRCADLLITSNSTFSWTASLLRTRENSISIIPSSFSLPEYNVANEIFRASSKWSIR